MICVHSNASAGKWRMICLTATSSALIIIHDNENTSHLGCQLPSLQSCSSISDPSLRSSQCLCKLCKEKQAVWFSPVYLHHLKQNLVRQSTQWGSCRGVLWESSSPYAADRNGNMKSTWPLMHAWVASHVIHPMTWDEFNPSERRNVPLSMKSNGRFSCHQLRAKRISNLIL